MECNLQNHKSKTMRPKSRKITCPNALQMAIAITIGSLVIALGASHAEGQNQTQPLSSRAAFLRAQRSSRLQQQVQPPQPAAPVEPKSQNVAEPRPAPAPAVAPIPVAAPKPPSVPQSSSVAAHPPAAPIGLGQASPVPLVAVNRTTRTADIFQNGDGYNIIVTNTCERELMHVNIRMSRQFYGVIHTKDQRDKRVCRVEGRGETEFNLDISHVLDAKDAAYCGVIRARKESPEDKDLLSVVLAVRLHAKVDLSDDKYFLLNCTNRCRRADCSSPSAKLIGPANNGLLESEAAGEIERESLGPSNNNNQTRGDHDECTIWKFPWLITLLWCMGILLVAMIISHCIMCSSFVCRCVKTEVEETEPSVYEGATDDEDSLYNRKSHPMRIDYDNRDIYKTSNNYQPYCLEDAQAKARQPKRAKHRSSRR